MATTLSPTLSSLPAGFVSPFKRIEMQERIDDALACIAILLVNYDPDTEIGRHVVWHHVRATDKTPSFHYVIDPAPWLEAKHHVTTDMRHLRLVGGYYIEVKLPTYASVKGR